jgi:hypothetical protein
VSNALISTFLLRQAAVTSSVGDIPWSPRVDHGMKASAPEPKTVI